MPPNKLQVSNLHCVRGDRRLLENIHFSLQSGQLMHLQGHNGSGKTTLMRTIAGLLPMESGEITWNAKNIHTQADIYRSNLLYLGHLNGLKEELNAVENLRMLTAIRGELIEEKTLWRILQDIGLRGHEDIPTKYLSQGQKRRVALARLWFNQAVLWLLDEPFSALDTAALQQLQYICREHLQSGGMLLLTSHQSVELLQQDHQTLTLGKQHA